MFVPAAASGLPEASTISGSRSVPSTSPSIEPTYPATNDPTRASASSQASIAARRSQRRAFAVRARMKRRSESRFRYASTSGLRSSSCEREQRLALGAAADRASDVKAGGRLGATGQDEAPELRQRLVEAVAQALERVDRRLVDTQAVGDAPRHGEIGAHVEELVLDPLQRLANLLRDLTGKDETERRVELVDGAEGPDPAVELRDARAVAERGLPRVAAARVDLREPNRLVALPHLMGLIASGRARAGGRGSSERSRVAGSRSSPRRSP